jgi:hypothetical protein
MQFKTKGPTTPGGEFWFPKAVPKHAFFCLLALSNKLTTSQRLAGWKFKGYLMCVFC